MSFESHHRSADAKNVENVIEYVHIVYILKRNPRSSTVNLPSSVSLSRERAADVMASFFDCNWTICGSVSVGTKQVRNQLDLRLSLRQQA